MKRTRSGRVRPEAQSSRLGVGVLALVAVGIGLSNHDLAAQDEFRWSGTIAADEWMAVQNINGDVEVEVTGGSEIELIATKRGDSDDFELVRIEVVETRDGIVVCTIHPSRGRNDTQECGDQEFDRPRYRGDSRVSVDYLVRVPSGTQMKSSTVNGDVLVNGTLRHAEATTVNGNVEVASRGSLKATTVNGSVDARLDGSELDGPVTLTTVNGSIYLDVNDDLNADVDAHWLSGGLRTELPLSVSGRMSRSAKGQLGSGGYEVKLRTVNGRIEIR